MATRNPNDLVPFAIPLYTEFSREMKSKGIDFIITCVLRTQFEHAALWAQGREELEVVNRLRRRANMAPITAADNEKQVTWKKLSKHVPDDANPKSRAFDIVIMNGGKPVWIDKADTNKDGYPDYKQAADIWKRLSPRCRAGYDFGDPAHFEVV